MGFCVMDVCREWREVVGGGFGGGLRDGEVGLVDVLCVGWRMRAVGLVWSWDGIEWFG